MRALKNNLFLLAMIVIIPAVSWMFLRTGVDYRLESLKDLEMKETINPNGLIPDSISLIDHVTLVCINGTDNVINQLYDQFKDAPVFQCISTSDLGTGIDKMSNFYSLNEEESRKLLKFSQFNDAKYALIDGDSNIRRIYKSDDEIKSLVRHIATILPYVERKKEKK